MSDRPYRPERLRFGRHEIPMPQARWMRITLGVTLVVFGIFGFLPVLGFWMVPLGLAILSVDFAFARRWRRRSQVAYERWRRRRATGEAKQP